MQPIKLFIAGDFCPVGRNEQPFSAGIYDAVEAVKPFMKDADFRIVNLEAPLTATTTAIPKTGPNIKADPETVKALHHLGIDLVTLANNHIQDFGSQGILDTLEVCRTHHIHTVGAGMNLAEASETFSITLKDRTIAILNFAENEFCIATEQRAGANPVHEIQNFYAIQEAKAKYDLVIVIVHGGREHYQLPTPKQRQRFRFYADAGADLVVGHHTHCFSGYEVYNDTPIFYSLGNFVFDYKAKYQTGKWTEGFAVNFTIGNTISYDIIPYKQGQSAKPELTLLNDEEEKEFFKKLDSLNEQITNDELFSKAWHDYLSTQKLNYKSMVTVQNKYLRAAMAKNLLPYISSHSKEHLLLLLNLMRCETHREITIDILSSELEK